MRRYNLSIRKPKILLMKFTKFYINLRPDLYGLKFDKDLLTILANGYKLAPFVIFKGNKDSPNIRKE